MILILLAIMKIKKFNKIYIAGHNGMVGSSILRYAEEKKIANKIITSNKLNLDLTNKKKTFNFLKKHRPDIVIICAAKVGGILANNKYPVDFLLNNIEIQNNLISGCHEAKIKNIIFLGSSCIYPKFYYKNYSSFHENHMLSNYLELTNEPYAIAKIAGIKLCESYNRQYNTNFRSIIPCNLYGPNDNYHPNNSHVLAALIRKFLRAKEKNLKEVKIWGSGLVKREFLHVDDLAKATFHICSLSNKKYKSLTKYQQSFINVGSGIEISINKLAKIICNIIDFDCKLVFDRTKPDGTKSKLLNIDKILSTGWRSEISLSNGIESIIKNKQFKII